MENCGMSDCVVCFRSFETNGIYPSENVRKVFTACSQHLKQDIFTKCWNALRPSEKNCPFCSECFTSGKKLSSLCHKLEQVQKEIDNFVQYFSAEIQRYRINENKTGDQDATQMQYEIPIENVIVKQENDYQNENEDDFTFSSVPSPVSPRGEVTLKTERGDNALDDDIGKDNEVAKIETRQLRRVIIPLQRLQYDLNGELIPESPQKTKSRKAIAKSSDEETSDDDSDYDPHDDSSDQLRRRKGRQKKRIKIAGRDMYECDECESSFLNKKSLDQHVLKKHRDDAQTFECAFCFSQYKVVKEFNRHLKLHSRSFTCQICGLTFGADGEERYFGCNQYDYEIHCLEHQEETPFQCQLCLEIFSNPKNYAHHHRAGCQVSPTPFNCQLCEKAFKYEYLLLIHQMDHREDPSEDNVECVICQKPYFRNRKKFKEKIKSHYLNVHTQEFPLPCDICGMPLRYIAQLESHRQCHKPNVPAVTGKVFNCPHCELTFKWSKSLKEHIIKKHDFTAEIFRCNVCTKEFKIRKEFHKHVKTHTTLLHCPEPDCEKTFTRESLLNMHIKIHTGEFTCHHCDKKFPTQHTLQVHIDSVHLNIKRFPCQLCDESFSTRERQRSHMKAHTTTTEQSDLCCKVCGEKFVREFSYKEHMRLHTGNPPDSSEFPFICDICGKLFRTKYSASQHQKTAHVEVKDGELPEGYASCEICEKTFTSKKSLQDHLTRKHDANAEIFNCPIENCKAKFKLKKELNTHIKRHSSRIPCGMCEKTFKCSSQVKVHRRLHTGELFPCEKCDKSFISAARLQSHVGQVHLKEKHFFCEICGKGFYDKKSYQPHLSTHSDEKKYECKVCGEKFNTEHKRKDHMRKMHTGESFDCHICSKNFTRKSTLQLHLKKHAGTYIRSKTKSKPKQKPIANTPANSTIPHLHHPEPAPAPAASWWPTNHYL